MRMIYCCQCKRDVLANLVFASTIYPHRDDLRNKNFYQCPHCGNYVGCHRDGEPLGTIPHPELRKRRHLVHQVIDGYWLLTKDRVRRKRLYKELSKFIGREYHTGELNSVEECNRVMEYYIHHFKQ